MFVCFGFIHTLEIIARILSSDLSIQNAESMQKRAKDSAPDQHNKMAVASAPGTRRAGGDKEEGGKHMAGWRTKAT